MNCSFTVLYFYTRAESSTIWLSWQGIYQWLVTLCRSVDKVATVGFFVVELKFVINNVALSMKERHCRCRSVGVGFNFLVTNEAYIIYRSLLLFEGGLLSWGPAFQPSYVCYTSSIACCRLNGCWYWFSLVSVGSTYCLFVIGCRLSNADCRLSGCCCWWL